MRPHLVPALLASAALLAGFTLWWRAPAPDAPALAPRRVDTSAITLELSEVHSSLSAATGERVVVAPRPVLAWTLEGDEPCPH